MNILLLNQNWLTGELRSLGHNVVSMGHGEGFDIRLFKPVTTFTEILELLPASHQPDLVMLLDNSSPLPYTGFADLHVPIVFISVDTFHHLDLHSAIAGMCDVTFVAQKIFLEKMSANGVDARWLPLWFSHAVDDTKPRNGKAGFIGTLDSSLNPKRVRFFEALKKKVPVDVFSGNWVEHVPTYDIIVNQSVQDDLNFRVFETMGAKTCLLTERSNNGLDELFTPGLHLQTYAAGDVEEAADKIQHMLADLRRTREMARLGYEEIRTKHMPLNRIQVILESVADCSRAARKQTNFIDLKNLDHLSYLWEGANDMPSVKATLHFAMDAFERAMKQQETVTQDFAAHALLAASRHDRLLEDKRGHHALDKAETNYPGFTNFGRIGIERMMEQSTKRAEERSALQKSLGFES